MRAKCSLLAIVLSVGVVYFAFPYVTLYRLGTAIQSADAATLETLVDWPAVREGIKEDICDFGTDASVTKTGAELPPFGASFMHGIESSSVDKAVTPQALLAAATSTLPAEPLPQQQHPRGADIHVDWAFFESLSSFLVAIKAPGQSEPIKLEMELHGVEWRVVRVWLPPELLSPGSRT